MRCKNASRIVLGLMLSSRVWAVEALETWDAYKDHLVALHLDNDRPSADKYLDQVRLKTRKSSSDLSEFAYGSKSESNRVDDSKIQKAIDFLTGSKQEIYCKNVGLVEIKGKHNDGTKSHLVLLNSNRVINDSYANIKDGNWVYELSSDYRSAAISDSWVISSADHSYLMKERREQLDSKNPDTGRYEASWRADGSKHSNSFSTHGEVFEPYPMYMANDYHVWGGNVSLGRMIEFKVGSKKEISKISQRGFGLEILLKSKQTVSKKLPTVSVESSNGRIANYQDCFQVDYEIQFDRLEE
jgi:hypothetical protein